MEAESLESTQPGPSGRPRINWESFYANYRKPGYVPGFEVVNKLGGGVFGMVFKARKESIGKDYAIKFLKVDDEVVRDAVVRELQTVRFFAQIDHPNLVSIEDKGEVDGIPFIIMSYAGDETLRKRLEAGPLSRDQAMRIFVQAARGVQALHERSLVHFDLKPANIFLKGDIARVGDYGLSKLVTESRNSLSFGRGTPYYMAPEMLQRRGDARSDVYSLGVLLYECLTGDVPFKGDTEWEVLRKHESAHPHYPANIGAADRAILDRCLAKDPDDRFQTAEELLHALHAPAALGESMVIPPPGKSAAADTARTAAPPPPPQPAMGAAATAAPGGPQSMPWRDPPAVGVGGVVGGAVHLVFRGIELMIMLALLPVRLLSMGLGHGLVFLVQLPFRILGLALHFAGYVLMAALLVGIVVGLIFLGSLFV